MIENERLIRHNAVVEMAHQMMIAARTAPKGKGVDLIEIALVSHRADLETLAQAMRKRAEESGMKFLLRDADNILSGEAVMLIGTKSEPLSLNCGHCGFASCAQKPTTVPCAINSVDVGIALGAACSKAADLRLDTRVMFSAGWCSQTLNWLPDCHQILAIAIGASSKNPFFDRKPKEEAQKQ
ncbi:MAG: ferredoxin domain-containing protein [Muribaculaceae bacterium]